MNNFDVAGILRTYSEKAGLARNTKHLRKLIRECWEELDLRKIRMEDRDERISYTDGEGVTEEEQ